MSDPKLHLDDLTRFPRPGMEVPHAFQFTPDGASVGYLYSAAGTLQQDLWLQDLSSGIARRLSETLVPGTTDEYSLEEELRRERSRTRASGVTAFRFGQDQRSGALLTLFTLGDGVYLARGDAAPQRLAAADHSSDQRLSPDGQWLAFVREAELFVMPSDGGTAPRQLTSGAGNGSTNGLAEYVAQEEIGRSEAYWWSPDSSRLAFVHADCSHIPLYPIVHQEQERPVLETHRYPFAGAANARVRLGVLPLEGGPGEVTWMDLGAEEDIYLARVNWRPDGVLTAQIQSRDQRSLRLVAFDSATGTATTLLEEQSELWINLHDDLRFLQSGEMVWASEQSGFRHLALHDAQGRRLRTLTDGPWLVTGQVALDERGRQVYFEGTREGATERHLYAVSLDGGPVRRITLEPGWHTTVVSPDYALCIDTWSNREQAPRVTVRSTIDGAPRTVLYANREVTPQTLGLVVPELLTLSNRDGVSLHAAVYATEETRLSNRPHPLIVSVYGGSAAQMVVDQWSLTVDLRAQYLAQQGFVVLKLDNRGTPNRGMAFEAPVAGLFGHCEVDDQVDGVRFLAQRSYVDGDRVGIYGWSFGGYMTLRALQRAPEIFKAGVAGAPVTFWDGYDTHYTERYMRQPADNAAGYQASSVLPYVDAMRGDLLIVHGLVDENVHVRHTVRLISALTAAAKPYDLVLLPEARHMPRRAADLRYLEQRLADFFLQHLS